MGVFHGCQIALELSSFIPLKKKQELRKLITSNDGIISFIVTKKCKLLVTLNDEEKAKDSFKCKTAVKYNIPVVESRYLYECVQMGQLVDPDPYVLMGNTKNQLLNTGVIAAPQGKASGGKMKKKPMLFNLNGIKVWTLSDKNAPSFPDDDYAIAKSIQLTKSEKKLFFVAEVHVATVSSDFKFRVFTHSGEIPTQTTDPDVEIGKKECRYTNSSDECLAIYSRMCQLQMDTSNGFTKTREYLGRNIGSKKFQQNQVELMVNTHGPDKEVSELVEHIWKEAMGELEDVLSVSIDNITVEQVEKAESILLELKRVLDETLDNDDKKTKLEKLSEEFYSQLNHSPTHQLPINSKHIISKKQELCQVIRDMVSVSEGTGWSRRCPTEAKYRSLRCHMVSHKETSPEYERIKNLVVSSQEGKSRVIVNSVFEVNRSVEDLAFASKLNDKRLLFHSSRVHNFVGILSRGLLLPKVVVDDFGGTRTDAGMLGSGIYFADDASTSAKYSQPSKCKGSRLMLVSEVALGKCCELFEHNTKLQAPPDGYNSVHGKKACAGIKSEFKDDEYAIYNTNQQRLRYLVEFQMESDVVKAPVEQQTEQETIEALPGFKPTGKISAKTVELNDIQNIPDPLSNVKAGLVSNSDAPVPLTAVHVKARLLDLAAQVIVLQHYRSEYNEPIEAKYVFPLDEMAAVCGFEAFINDKHIVGEVKEKETAHREYREAISQGHGAYLMDQDVETPDVFTVSVGNLPPFCDVLIKITYVAELQMDGEKISFRIPACVAPWKKAAGLGTQTQRDLDTVKVTKDEVETSVQVAIEMPFEIKQIDCPTHRIRLKKTETKAVVEMRKNQPIDEGFQLLISLAEIHVPRMWVEQLPDNPDSRACMLTFYPEFEASVSESFEVIFLLDLSNSMKGSSLTDAKKILLLALHLLPESCYFNVIIFGTDYDELFPCGRTKTLANAKLAEKFIKSQEAVMGNTEVIRPLNSLFLVCPEDSIQNLFLVSDGHISNEQTTLDAIRTNSGRSRVFTFGVGSVANQHTLRSLARAGCGYYEFFNSKMKSRWETKIRNQLSKAAQPSLSSICVEWHNFNAVDPVQAPAEIMALFNGCRQVVYGFVPNCTHATLKAVIDNQEVSTMVSTAELNITTGKILHQLTARAVIQDWNDGQLAAERLEHEILKKNRKNYIIKLSIDFSIITQFTSFVAIEKREKDEVVTALQNLDELVAKDSVDILDYMGWENVRCRVNVKTFNHQPFLLDLDLNDTIGNIKSKISDVTSDHRDLKISLYNDPVSDDDAILWDQKIEDGSTVYGTLSEIEKEEVFMVDGDALYLSELLAEYEYEHDERMPVEAVEKIVEEAYAYFKDGRPTRQRIAADVEVDKKLEPLCADYSSSTSESEESDESEEDEDCGFGLFDGDSTEEDNDGAAPGSMDDFIVGGDAEIEDHLEMKFEEQSRERDRSRRSSPCPEVAIVQSCKRDADSLASSVHLFQKREIRQSEEVSESVSPHHHASMKAKSLSISRSGRYKSKGQERQLIRNVMPIPAPVEVEPFSFMELCSDVTVVERADEAIDFSLLSKKKKRRMIPQLRSDSDSEVVVKCGVAQPLEDADIEYRRRAMSRLENMLSDDAAVSSDATYAMTMMNRTKQFDVSSLEGKLEPLEEISASSNISSKYTMLRAMELEGEQDQEMNSCLSMTASVEPLEPSVSLPRMKKKTRSGVSGLYLNRGGITLPSVPLEDADIDECRTMSAKMQLLSDDASPVIEYAEKRDADTLRSKIRLGGAAVNRCRPLRKAHAELDLMRPEPTSTDATFSAVDKRDEESQLHSDMFLSASQDVDAKPVPRYLYKSSALHEPQSQPSASLDDGLFDAWKSGKSMAAPEPTGATDLFGIRFNAPPVSVSSERGFSEARMESCGATPAFYAPLAGAAPAVGFGGFGGDAPLWGASSLPPPVPGSGAPPPPPPPFPGSGLFGANATTAFGSSAFGVGVPQSSVTPAIGFGAVGGGGAPMAFGSSALESSGFAFGGGATTTCAAPALAFDAGVSVADRVQAISGGLFGNMASAPVVSDAVTQGFAQAFASPGFGYHSRAPQAHAAPALGFGLFSTDAPVASDAVAQGFGAGAASTFAAPAFAAPAFSAQSFAAPAFAAPVFAAPAFAAPAFDRCAPPVRAAPPSDDALLFGSDEALVTSDTFLASSAAVGFHSSFGSSASSATVSAKRGPAPASSDGVSFTSADVTPSIKGKLTRFSHAVSSPPPPSFARRAHPPAPPPPPPEPMPIPGFAVASTTSSYIVAPREWSMHSMRHESVASALPEPQQTKAAFSKILHDAVSREAVPEPERIQKLRASAENLSLIDLSLPPPPPGQLRLPFMAKRCMSKKKCYVNDGTAAILSSSLAYMPTSPSYVPTAQQQMETEPLPSSVTTDSLMPTIHHSFMKMMDDEPQAQRRQLCLSSRAVCGLSADVSATEESIKLPYAPPANQRFRRMKSECRSTSQHMPALPPPMGSVLTEKELAPPLPPKKLQSGRGMMSSQSGAFRHRRVLSSSDSDSQALAPIRLSIGIETFGKVMTPIFKYSTPLPATMTKYLTTCADYQTSVRIKVYEGEYPRTSLNHLLGQIQLSGIQPMIRGHAKIKAIFNIDVEGSLRVEVVDETSGEYETMTVTINEEEKSEEEIKRMIKDAEEMKRRESVEEEDDIQETSDGDWDVCIYDELNAGNVPDFREDLFVSAKEMNINTGFVDWTQHTLEALSTSYIEVSIWPAETKEGFWELDDGLGELLFLDTKKCRKILIENGLNSLGTQAHLDVSRLIATFLVLFRTFELRGPLAPYPVNATQFNEHLDSIIAGCELESFPRSIRELLTCAARFCRRIDTKHPLLYSRLNLGRSWPEVAVNMGLALPDEIDEIGEAALMASLLG